MIFDVGNTLLHVDYGHIAAVLCAQGHAVDADAVRVAEYAAKAALDPAVRAGGDTGKPVALRNGNDPHGTVFLELAQRTIERIREVGPPTGPKIEISE